LEKGPNEGKIDQSPEKMSPTSDRKARTCVYRGEDTTLPADGEAARENHKWRGRSKPHITMVARNWGPEKKIDSLPQRKSFRRRKAVEKRTPNNGGRTMWARSCLLKRPKWRKVNERGRWNGELCITVPPYILEFREAGKGRRRKAAGMDMRGHALSPAVEES